MKLMSYDKLISLRSMLHTAAHTSRFRRDRELPGVLTPQDYKEKEGERIKSLNHHVQIYGIAAQGRFRKNQHIKTTEYPDFWLPEYRTCRRRTVTLSIPKKG
jgi:hypothetical protein